MVQLLGFWQVCVDEFARWSKVMNLLRNQSGNQSMQFISEVTDGEPYVKF
jgi:heme-degrading monooxygenase HmoA